MFGKIDTKILDRMKYLEELDAADRRDGTERMKRLRQIPPETGRFLAIMASMVPDGDFIEIGTSAGYSTLWLALAAREKNHRVTTFELLEDKIKLAGETFLVSGVNDVVELIGGGIRIPKI